MNPHAAVRIDSRSTLILAEPILDALPDGVLVLDARGRIELVNLRVEEMAGYAASELVGRGLESIIPDRHQVFYELEGANPSSAMRGSPAAGVVTRLERKDGTELAIEIWVCPVEVEGERATIAALRDVSERRVPEATFLETHGQIDPLVDADVIDDLHEHAAQALLGIGLNLHWIRLTTIDEETRGNLAVLIGATREALDQLRGSLPALHHRGARSTAPRAAETPGSEA